MYEKDSLGRPSFIDVLMEAAFVISKRSLDPRTKHGCILTDGDHTIVSVGYNSPIRGIDDSKVPLEAPAKYLVFSHAEKACLLNCDRAVKNIRDSKCIVTGICCNGCLYDLAYAGVKTVYMANRMSHMLNTPEFWKDHDFIVDLTGIKVHLLEMKPEWERHLNA